MGLVVEDWEKITPTPWKSVGTFESTIFNPANWKETHPFLPIRRSRSADNYWGAKLAALTPKHLEMLVHAAHFPEPNAAEYVLKTLLERRQKILNYFLAQVSPVELKKIEQNKIYFHDLGREPQTGSPTRAITYKIQLIDDQARELIPGQNIYSEQNELVIPLDNKIFDRADNYLTLKIRVIRGDGAPAPAQFHFLRDETGSVKLVGVMH